MTEKTKIPQWLVNIFIGLIIGAYGFIFSSVLDRISCNEDRIEKFNPIFVQIQTDLSSIKTNIEWLKNNK